MSRANEVRCLENIKNAFYGRNHFKREFDNSDFLKMNSILSTVCQNKKDNIFPDFFFDGGIIEHFEVSASNETKKGSQYRINDASCQREKERYFQEQDQKFLESSCCPGTITTATVEDTHECFSYESFVKSFKRNTERHLKSLRNSGYTNQVVVFLIEFESARLGVYVNSSFDRFYKLCEDKNLLEYMKETLVDVNYIIFVANDSYEIIDLFKIGPMIVTANDNLDIRGGRQKNISLKVYVDP